MFTWSGQNWNRQGTECEAKKREWKENRTDAEKEWNRHEAEMQ